MNTCTGAYHFVDGRFPGAYAMPPSRGTLVTPMLWLVSAALIVPYLPYLYVVVAKRMSPQGYDSSDPRGQSANLVGTAKRAQAAHLNAFEAVPPFLFAGLLIAYLGADGLPATFLAVAWHLSRLAYTGFYLADMPTLRSTAWGLGVVVTIAMVGLAAYGHA